MFAALIRPMPNPFANRERRSGGQGRVRAEGTGSLRAEDYPELPLAGRKVGLDERPKVTPARPQPALAEPEPQSLPEAAWPTLEACQIVAELACGVGHDVFLDGQDLDRQGLALDAVITHLASAEASLRGFAVEAMEALAFGADLDALPDGILEYLLDHLVPALCAETDPALRRRMQGAAAALIGAIGARGDYPGMACKLHWVVAEAAAVNPAVDRQLRTDPSLVRPMFEALCRLGVQALEERAAPFLRLLGRDGLRTLLGMLAAEPDRQRRYRLLQWLKSQGEAALPVLHDALGLGPWFFQRNLITVIAEVGCQDSLARLLPHVRAEDARVARAAVHAVARLGGAGAEATLVALAKDLEGEPRAEAMRGLAKLGTRSLWKASMPRAAAKGH